MPNKNFTHSTFKSLSLFHFCTSFVNDNFIIFFWSHQREFFSRMKQIINQFYPFSTKFPRVFNSALRSVLVHFFHWLIVIELTKRWWTMIDLSWKYYCITYRQKNTAIGVKDKGKWGELRPDESVRRTMHGIISSAMRILNTTYFFSGADRT